MRIKTAVEQETDVEILLTRHLVSGEGQPLLLLRRHRGERLRLAWVPTELPPKHRVSAPNLPGAERWLYGEAQARTRGREDR